MAPGKEGLIFPSILPVDILSLSEKKGITSQFYLCPNCFSDDLLKNDCFAICNRCKSIITISTIEIPIKISVSWNNLARIKENYRNEPTIKS